MKKWMIPMLSAALLSGCLFNNARTDADNSSATASTDSSAPAKKTKLEREREKYQSDDPRECVQNFTFDGSFARGRTFKSNAFVKNVTQAVAIKRAVRYLTNGGWQINNVNESLGIISASQTVSYGNGKTVPFNVGIEQAKGGVNVDLSYKISGGLSSPVDAVRNEFCAVVESVGAK
ncbi:MAG: hypothetical protein LBG61_01080 [Burkholderiales bacterium]|jgi:hypothetical protein|nr:hypothetical protein [Burkholderiales bacterium]